jgi:uncharacterized membrane protein YoaK (UPF0700 family)
VPLASDPRLSGTRILAVVLTATGGFVDAHVFLHLARVFVANMSGNLVLFGMAIGDHQWTAGAHQGTALVAFVIGVFTASRFHDLRRRTGRPLRPDLLLATEATLLAAVAIWVLTVGAGHEAERIVIYPAIIVAAFAMGMQNAALLRVGAVAVATTYASGSVARFGSESALAFGAGSSEKHSAHRRAMAVLGSLVVAYVTGATIAAAVGASAAWLFLPCAALAWAG